MMSVRECTKLYNKMLKMHESKAEPNRVNCYRCDKCGSITKTIDVDDGVTPYCYICECCAEAETYTRMVSPNIERVLKVEKRPIYVESYT